MVVRGQWYGDRVTFAVRRFPLKDKGLMIAVWAPTKEVSSTVNTILYASYALIISQKRML